MEKSQKGLSEEILQGTLKGILEGISQGTPEGIQEEGILKCNPKENAWRKPRRKCWRNSKREEFSKMGTQKGTP